MILSNRERLLLESVIKNHGESRGLMLDRWIGDVGITGPESWAKLPFHPENILLPAVISSMAKHELENHPHRPILSGIKRSTLANNLALIGRGKDLIDNFGAHVKVALIKGSALIAHGLPLARRRISDLDIVVPRSDVKSALELLESRNYFPLYGVTNQQIVNRELVRRSGWNFMNSEGSQIDLHWSLFGLEARHRTVTTEFWKSVETKELLGASVPVGTVDFCLAYSSYHSRTRATRNQHLSAISDAIFFSSERQVSSVHQWAVDGLHERWILEDWSTVRDITQELSLEIPAASQAIEPPGAPWETLSPVKQKGLKQKARVAEFLQGLDRAFYRGPRLLTGVILHLAPEVLQPLTDRPGWLTKPSGNSKYEESGEIRIDCTNPTDFEQVATIGWEWDPLDQCLWADSADSRLVFQKMKPESQFLVTFDLHPLASNRPREDGQFSANPRGRVFQHGRELMKYNLWELHSPNTLTVLASSSRRGILELSFRPDAPLGRQGLNAIYGGWLRGIPIQMVSVGPAHD
jgi:hypothetical protein